MTLVSIHHKQKQRGKMKEEIHLGMDMCQWIKAESNGIKKWNTKLALTLKSFLYKTKNNWTVGQNWVKSQKDTPDPHF